MLASLTMLTEPQQTPSKGIFRTTLRNGQEIVYNDGEAYVVELVKEQRRVPSLDAQIRQLTLKPLPGDEQRDKARHKSAMASRRKLGGRSKSKSTKWRML